jgi:hypothetical protein
VGFPAPSRLPPQGASGARQGHVKGRVKEGDNPSRAVATRSGMLLWGSSPTRAAGARAMENISLSNFLVIIVAIPLVVAVIGALLGNWIDRWLATVSTNYRRASGERKAADLALFAELEERGLLPIFLMRCSFYLTINIVAFLGLYVGLALLLLYTQVAISQPVPLPALWSPGAALGVGLGVVVGLLW